MWFGLWLFCRNPAKFASLNVGFKGVFCCFAQAHVHSRSNQAGKTYRTSVGRCTSRFGNGVRVLLWPLCLVRTWTVFCFGSFMSALYFVAFHMLRSISEYFVIIVHAVAWVLCVRCRHSAVVICCLCELYLLKVIPFTAYPGHDLTAWVAVMFKFMHSLRMPDSTFGVCRVQYYPLEFKVTGFSLCRALMWCLLHTHTQRAYVHAVPRH